MSLEATAQEAWNLCHVERFHKNWGKALIARRVLRKYTLRDPNPKIRRIASTYSQPDSGKAA